VRTNNFEEDIIKGEQEMMYTISLHCGQEGRKRK
jgi:hypothetical protein